MSKSLNAMIFEVATLTNTFLMLSSLFQLLLALFVSYVRLLIRYAVVRRLIVTMKCNVEHMEFKMATFETANNDNNKKKQNGEEFVPVLNGARTALAVATRRLCSMCMSTCNACGAARMHAATREACAWISWALPRVLGANPLRVHMCCSFVLEICGSPGLVAYSAGARCTYMLTYAHGVCI